MAYNVDRKKRKEKNPKEDEKMKIQITYKNGNKLEQKVNWLHIEEGQIVFSKENKVGAIFSMPVFVRLKNIKELKVLQED